MIKKLSAKLALHGIKKIENTIEPETLQAIVIVALLQLAQHQLDDGTIDALEMAAWKEATIRNLGDYLGARIPEIRSYADQLRPELAGDQSNTDLLPPMLDEAKIAEFRAQQKAAMSSVAADLGKLEPQSIELHDIGYLFDLSHDELTSSS